MHMSSGVLQHEIEQRPNQRVQTAESADGRERRRQRVRTADGSERKEHAREARMCAIARSRWHGYSPVGTRYRV